MTSRTILLFAVVSCSLWLRTPSCAASNLQETDVAELVADHAVLQADAQEVEGAFKVFEASRALVAELTQDDRNLNGGELKLKRSGKLWRSKTKFRASWTEFNAAGDEGPKYILAEDSLNYYEYTSATYPPVLKIVGKGTSEAEVLRGVFDGSFYFSLDSLWSSGGLSVTSMLQRPDATLTVASDGPLKGCPAVLIRDKKRTNQVVLECSRRHPFGFAEAKISQFYAARRVFSRHIGDGAVVPARVVDVMGNPPTVGQTTVVEFDLARLDLEASPLAVEFSDSSFNDFGSGYQVYKTSLQGVGLEKQEIGASLPRLSPPKQKSSSFAGRWLIVANVLVLLGLSLVLWRRKVFKGLGSRSD